SDRRTETIRLAAAGPLDWSSFLRVVRRHQITVLAHQGLALVRPNLPPGIAREIGTQAAIAVRENLASAAEAVRLQCLFDNANLPVVFLKGASLAVLAYGNLALRGGKDIDLMVPSETLPAAMALLVSAGYHRFDPPADVNAARMRLLIPLR